MQYRRIDRTIFFFIATAVFSFLIFPLFLDAKKGSLPAGWDKPISIAVKNIKAGNPGYCASKNKFYLVFNGEKIVKGISKNNIYFTENKPGTLSFLKPKPLLTNSRGFNTNPSIAAGNGRTVIVFQDESETGLQLGVRIRESANEPFNKSDPIIFENGMALFPQLFHSKGRFHLFYMLGKAKFSVNYSYSDDGEDWSGSEQLGGTLSEGIQGNFFPGIGVKGENIDIVFQKRGKNLPDELFYIYSKNNGSSFSDAQQITNNKFKDFSPQPIRTKKSLLIVYQAKKNITWDIFYKKLEGEKWSTPFQLSQKQSQAYRPAIFSDHEKRANICWYGEQKQIKYTQIYCGFLDETKPDKIKDNRISPPSKAARNPVGFKLGGYSGVLYRIKAKHSYFMIHPKDEKAEMPKIKSSTHPENKVVKSSNVIFTWKKPYDISGIAGYAMQITQSPDSEPEQMNLGASSVKYVQKKMTSGYHYFHLRAVDKAGNISKTAHYKFGIDSEVPGKPNISSDTHNNLEAEPGDKLEFSISSFDDSGIKYYKYVHSKNAAAKLTLTSKKEELVLYNRPAGTYYLRIQAVDNVGNTSLISSYKHLVSTPTGTGTGKQPAPGIALPDPGDDDFYTKRKIRVKLIPVIDEKILGVAYKIDENETDPSTKIKTKKLKFNAKFKESGNYFINLWVKYQYSGWSEIKRKAISIELKKAKPSKRPYIALYKAEPVFFEGDDIDEVKLQPDHYEIGKKLKRKEVLTKQEFFLKVKRPKIIDKKVVGFTYIIQDEKKDPKRNKKNIVKKLDEPLTLTDGKWYLGVRLYYKDKTWSPVAFKKIVVELEKIEHPPSDWANIIYLFAVIIAAGLTLVSPSMIFFKPQVLFALNKILWWLK
jgi:hypothetical protein